MTGPVEFLEAAHKQAEEAARATTPVPRPGEWIATRDKHDDDAAPLALVQGRDEDAYDWMGEDYRSGLPVIVHAAEWQDEAEANLRHITLNDPHSVLRRIAAERRLLDDLNSEKHEVVEGDCWYTCAAATEERDGGETCDDSRTGAPCDCGRDARVQRRVRLLAEGWGWTEETT